MVKAELGYFEQSRADGPVFTEMVERYGVSGVLLALQNVLRGKEDGPMCSNKCTLRSNLIWELQACDRAIKEWTEGKR